MTHMTTVSYFPGLTFPPAFFKVLLEKTTLTPEKKLFYIHIPYYLRQKLLLS